MSPSVANRARFTAAARSEKSVLTFGRPRTQARRPPCLRFHQVTDLHLRLGRGVACFHAGSVCRARPRVRAWSCGPMLITRPFGEVVHRVASRRVGHATPNLATRPSLTARNVRSVQRDRSRSRRRDRSGTGPWGTGRRARWAAGPSTWSPRRRARALRARSRRRTQCRRRPTPARSARCPCRSCREPIRRPLLGRCRRLPIPHRSRPAAGHRRAVPRPAGRRRRSRP